MPNQEPLGDVSSSAMRGRSTDAASSDSEAASDYTSIPMIVAYHVRAKYVYAGELESMQYPFD